MAGAADYEQLGSFYLGRSPGPDGEPGPEPQLYAARDLTTHAVCLGMTGSGKTVALLWRPYWLGADGLARPAFSEPA